MKGTRLWQKSGSPLISGRSRRERPFWQQVLLAWVCAVAVTVVLAVVLVEMFDLSAPGAPVDGLPTAASALVGSLAYAAVPSLVGSLFGVWLARNMGWRRPWVAGASVAVLAALLWLAMSASSL